MNSMTPVRTANFRTWLRTVRLLFTVLFSSSSSTHSLLNAWTLERRLSDLDESFPEDELLRNVAALERAIHAAPGGVRGDLHRALVTLGGRSPALRVAMRRRRC